MDAGHDHLVAQTLDLVAKYGRWVQARAAGEREECAEFALDTAIDIASFDPQIASGVISGLLALMDSYCPDMTGDARVAHLEVCAARLGS